MTMTIPGNGRTRPLLIGAIGLVALPFAMHALGLTLDTAIVVVILCMATMSLNLLVGYTGLVSFGHSAWFGIGGYAAARRWSRTRSAPASPAMVVDRTKAPSL